MILAPLRSRAVARRERWLGLALVGVVAAACGGRSHSPANATSGAGGSGRGGAGDAARAGDGPDPSGASGAGGSVGGSGPEAGGASAGRVGQAGLGGSPATGGLAGKPSGRGGSPGNLGCWNWDQIANPPKAGETGILVCPQFDEIQFVLHENCRYEATPNDPVEPKPGGPTGDCCYNITYVQCR